MPGPQNLEIWKLSLNGLLASLGAQAPMQGQPENSSPWKVECLSHAYPSPAVDSLHPYAGWWRYIHRVPLSSGFSVMYLGSQLEADFELLRLASGSASTERE